MSMKAMAENEKVENGLTAAIKTGFGFTKLETSSHYHLLLLFHRFRTFAT